MKEPSNSVWVGNIPTHIDGQSLKGVVIALCGVSPVSTIVSPPNSKHPLCHGWVNCSSELEAKQVASCLNGYKIGNVSLVANVKGAQKSTSPQKIAVTTTSVLPNLTVSGPTPRNGEFSIGLDVVKSFFLSTVWKDEILLYKGRGVYIAGLKKDSEKLTLAGNPELVQELGSKIEKWIKLILKYKYAEQISPQIAQKFKCFFMDGAIYGLKKDLEEFEKFLHQQKTPVSQSSKNPKYSKEPLKRSSPSKQNKNTHSLENKGKKENVLRKSIYIGDKAGNQKIEVKELLDRLGSLKDCVKLNVTEKKIMLDSLNLESLSAAQKNIEEYLDNNLLVEKEIPLDYNKNNKEDDDDDDDDDEEEEEEEENKTNKIWNTLRLDRYFLNYLISDKTVWRQYRKLCMIGGGIKIMKITSKLNKGGRFVLQGKRKKFQKAYESFTKQLQRMKYGSVTLNPNPNSRDFVLFKIKQLSTPKAYNVLPGKKKNMKAVGKQTIKVDIIAIDDEELKEAIENVRNLEQSRTESINLNFNQRKSIETLKKEAEYQYGVECRIMKDRLIINGIGADSVKEAKGYFIDSLEGGKFEKVNIPVTDRILMSFVKLPSFKKQLESECNKYKVNLNIFRDIILKGKKKHIEECKEAVRKLLFQLKDSMVSEELQITQAELKALREDEKKKIAGISKKYSVVIDLGISNSNPFDTTTTTTATKTPPKPLKKSHSSLRSELYCKWYWRDDDGDWTAFLDDENKVIEKNRKAGSFLFKLELRGAVYEIDLQKKTQQKLGSGHIRNLKQMREFSNVEWFWQNDQSIWESYNMTDTQNIEQAYQQKQRGIELQVTRRSDDCLGIYHIEFDYHSESHRQFNTATNHKRNVKRKEEKQVLELEEKEDDDDEEEEDDSQNLSLTKKVGIRATSKSSLDACKKAVQNLLDSYMKEDTINVPNLTHAQINQIAERYAAKIISISNGKVKVKIVDMFILNLRYELSDAALKCLPMDSYPDCWKKQEDFELVKLDPTSNFSEYSKIQNRIQETMPQVQIVSIERVENKWLWDKYQSQQRLLAAKNNGNYNENWLFHGTRGTDPHLIYKGQDGFDMRHASDGLWGRGTYFAYNASYSNDYAFPQSGNKKFFFAQVLLGETISTPQNRSLKLPPPKNSNSSRFAVETYDSVQGYTQNSIIYIVYENSRAYPSYLVTYK